MNVRDFLLALFDTLLLLAVFFLGFNASVWTNQQVRNYCYYAFYTPKTYDYWGNPIIENASFNVEINISGG